MATGKRLVFHAIGVIHHVVTLCILNSFDFRETNNVVLMQIHEFSYKYFTIWTFAFQLIFLVCALICDIGEIKPDLAEMLWPKHGILEKCGKLKDFMFHTIIFPCTGHTVIAFWSVYLYDRELVLPSVIDKYIHPILNHAVHTNIIAVVLLEIILGNTKYLKTNLKKSLLSIGVLAFVYYTIVIWTYYTSGKWIYKFFDMFTTWTERCMFFASCVVCLYLMFFLGIHAQEIITEYNIIKKKSKSLREMNKTQPNGDTKRKEMFKTLTDDFKILRNIND